MLAKAPVGHVTSGGGPRCSSSAVPLFVARSRGRCTDDGGRRGASWLSAVAIVPVLGVVHCARRRPALGSRRSVLRRRSGRCRARHVAGRRATVLVDGGPDEELVATDLAALGVKRLDVMVATHPHADHIIGLPHVLGACPVGARARAGLPRDLRDPGRPRHARSPTSTSRSGTRGPATPSPSATFVSTCCRRIAAGSGTNSDANNDSLVILLHYREDTVLFGGEPEQPAQQVLLDEQAPLHAELLKVPHHGAATSLPEFFQAVDAELAVISRWSAERLRAPGAVARSQAIAATGAQIWRTDQHGDIMVTFGSQGISVRSDR